jgi:RimJ/RimL family protein N-acetyltransferase
LSIRKLTKEDAPAIHHLLSVLTHQTLMNYGRFNEAEIDEGCLQIQHDIESGMEIAYGYFDPMKNELIGYLHFNLSNKFSRKNYQASLGIVIAESHQHLGHGRELLKHGLDEMRKKQYGKIWLHVHRQNKAAIRLYEKFGFEIEGIFRKDEIFDGEIIDTVSMAKFL